MIISAIKTKNSNKIHGLITRDGYTLTLCGLASTMGGIVDSDLVSQINCKECASKIEKE